MPVSEPLEGVILDVPGHRDAEEQTQDDDGVETRSHPSRRISSRNKGRTKPGAEEHERIATGGLPAAEEGVGAANVAPLGLRQALKRIEDAHDEGAYAESEVLGKGGSARVARAGVRVGRGAGLYHKFAQGDTPSRCDGALQN